jgi:tetratricopeptide (TPR) repeat protein
MQFRRAGWIAILFCSCALAKQAPDAHRYFEQARQLFEQRQWDEAQTAAEKALALDPRNGDAEILLGLIATMRTRFSEAEAHFVRAVSMEPDNPQAHAYLGSTYLQENRLSEAAEAFHKVLQLSPGNVTANYNLGTIALARNAPTEALQYFELVVGANSSDIPGLIGKLESQLMLNQKQDARTTTLRLERLLGDNDPRLFQVATLLAQHGESAAAIPLIERVQRAFPQSYDVNYNLALACLQAGNYDKASKALQPLTGPQGKAEAFDLLGTIEDKKAHAVAAEQAFQEASQREPTNEDYRFNYANALLQHGKVQAAIAAFRAALVDVPGSAKLRIGLGSAYYLSGDYEESVQMLLEALKSNPDSATAFFLLGEAYDSAARFQPAIESAFESYVKTSPRDPWAYYHYGAILYQRMQAAGNDNYESAKTDLQEALRLNPNFAEAYFQLGLIELTEGKTEQGINALKKAISLDPQLAPAHYRLGLAYQRAGNQALAKQELDEFRTLKNQQRYQAQVLQSLSSMGR